MDSDTQSLYVAYIFLAIMPELGVLFYVILLLVLVLLLYLSAMLAGAETAFFSVMREEANNWKFETSLKVRQANQLLEKPKRLLATILIFNNLINISFISLTAFLFRETIHSVHLEGIILLVITLPLTVILLFFGELLPKMYANQRGEFFINRSIYLVQWAYFLFKPLANWMVQISSIAEKRIKKKSYKINFDELPEMIDEIELDAQTSEKDREILKGIVNFSQTTVQEIMTSRMNMIGVDLETSFEDLLMQIKENGYSRMPVYKDNLDDIEGILYVKDLLPFLDNQIDFEWQTLIRPRYYVPDNKRIDKLLKEFQAKRVHMAIVVDEYGGTAGLVTMEDIIEEIVGEINDESDEDENKQFTKIDESTFLFEGKIALSDFCKVLEIDEEVLDEVRGDSQSLGGLLLEMFGRFPKLNEKKQFDKFLLTIVSATAKQIKVIKVTILDTEKLKMNSEK